MIRSGVTLYRAQQSARRQPVGGVEPDGRGGDGSLSISERSQRPVRTVPNLLGVADHDDAHHACLPARDGQAPVQQLMMTAAARNATSARVRDR